MSDSNFYKWYGYTGVLPRSSTCGSGGNSNALMNDLQVAGCLTGVNGPLKVCGDLEVQGYVDVQDKIINTTDPAVLIDQDLNVNGDINILSSEIKFKHGVKMSGNDTPTTTVNDDCIGIGSGVVSTGINSVAVGHSASAT